MYLQPFRVMYKPIMRVKLQAFEGGKQYRHESLWCPKRLEWGFACSTMCIYIILFSCNIGTLVLVSGNVQKKNPQATLLHIVGYISSGISTVFFIFIYFIFLCSRGGGCMLLNFAQEPNLSKSNQEE